MKKISLFAAAVLLMSFFTGCQYSSQTHIPGSVEVFYVNAGSYEEAGNYICSRSCDNYGENRSAIDLAMEMIVKDDENGSYTSVFKNGVSIQSYLIMDANLIVHLSGEYRNLSDIDKTALKTCLVHTACGIDGINSVSLVSSGELVERRLTADDFIISDNEASEFERRLILYFPDSSNNFLKAEPRVLTVSQEKNLVAYIIDELMKGPHDEGLHSIIPIGTKVNSIDIQGDICTLDLSADFVNNKSKTASGERMTVYSIVNTITALDEISFVRFHIDGEDGKGYEYISLGDTFSAFPGFVYDYNNAYEEPGVIYVSCKETEKLIEMPIVLQRNLNSSLEETSVEYLLSTYIINGYTSPIPPGLRLQSMQRNGTKCVVELNEALYSNGKGMIALKAANAVAFTVLRVGNATSVDIIVNGEPYLENVGLDKSLTVK
jgi:spore germination protein GerM